MKGLNERVFALTVEVYIGLHPLRVSDFFIERQKSTLAPHPIM